MITINDMNKEQLLELLEAKDNEIARLKEEVSILDEIARQLFGKLNPADGEGEHEGCCADRHKGNGDPGCSCSCGKG
ncbi:MAG: hypothetical protein R6W96_06610 [Clostridia bacterium]